ncbi:unnamed protein product [Pieris brassicae]|uniref:Uncharacterized protein n=1 Tax=Pieris brassicae TaxID=7116 RepID=A0A9P0XEJ5_PIEBR|nr:unnamed protein product [Pieris brassicae]
MLEIRIHLQQSATVWQHNNSKHNDIIGGGIEGRRDAGRMRCFDGQGRGRAILLRAAAAASPTIAPLSEN